MGTERKIKVAFILPTLGAGGAERVMSFVSQNLDKSKFVVSLVVTGSEKESRYIVQGIEVVFLNKKRVLHAIPALLNYLKKEKADIVISAQSHLNVVLGLLSMLFQKTKFVGREVNVTSVLKKFPQNNDRSYPKFLSKWGYSFLDAIICQSNDMLTDFRSAYPALENKLKVINNPITDNFIPKNSKPAKGNKYQFITVGSLEPRKGHSRVLKALAKLNIPFTYTIVGDGSQKIILQELISKLDLQNKCIHLPFSKKVNEHLSENHIFLQGSYVEGFPNALLESCAVGTPVIAFNAPGGIDEIVENGVNGFIVEDESEFLTAITSILSSDKFEPDEVSRSVIEKYGSDKILSKYESLIYDLVIS